jgi:hypothetical protein
VVLNLSLVRLATSVATYATTYVATYITTYVATYITMDVATSPSDVSRPCTDIDILEIHIEISRTEIDDCRPNIARNM